MIYRVENGLAQSWPVLTFVACWVLSNSFIVIMVLYVVCLSHLFVDIHVPVHVVFVKSPVVLSANTLSGQCVSLSTCIVIRSIVCKLVLEALYMRNFIPR